MARAGEAGITQVTIVPDAPGRITEREFWDRIIQGLLILLGAIEEYLGKERSVTPKHKRERHDNVPDVR